MTQDLEIGIDGFPLDPSAPGFYYQRELNSWLERDNPNSTPPAMDLQDPGELPKWLSALAQRLDWILRNQALLPQSLRWRTMLYGRISIGLNRLNMRATPLDEQTIVDLAGLIEGEELLRRGGCSDFYKVIGYSSLTPRVCQAMRRALRVIAPDSPTAVPHNARFAWTLFLEPEDSGDGEPCWSAAVRRELRSLKPTVHKKWMRLMQLAPFGLPHEVNEKWAAKVRKAVDSIGQDEVIGRTTEWLERFRQPEAVTMEFSGQTLLRLLLELSALHRSASLVEAATWPASATWASERSLEFWLRLLPRYLSQLVSTPSARGAISAMAAQPYAARVPEIAQALQSLPPAGQGANETPGMEAIERRIDQLLKNISDNRGRTSFDVDVEAALRHLQPDGGLETQIELALRQRIEWLDAHMPPQFDKNGQPSMEWAEVFQRRTQVNRIHAHLIRAGVPLDISSIVELLGQGGFAAFERAAAFTKEHGYHLEIVNAVRKFEKTLYGSIADQTMRRHVSWWLWLEDCAPIDDGECFSSVIRRDLRTMPAEKKKAWLAVLSNMTFAIGGKAPAKWAKPAKKALDALGADEFHSRIRAWFSVFRGEKPLNASTAGTDLLRCLIWDYALMPAEPRTDEAYSWIGKAKWKNNKARDRVLKTLAPLCDLLVERNPDMAWETLDSLVAGSVIEERCREHETYLDLCRRLNRPQRQARAGASTQPANPLAPAVLLKKVFKHLPGGDRIEVGDSHILVRGELDEYRIAFDGHITRRSGRTVRIDMDSVPSPLSGILQSGIDAADLQVGMFGVNLQRIAVAVWILSQDRHWEAAIE